ncbi:MAG: hypothetical protein EA406_01420 [Rhodospirillales bacterium]|nr:MAG: hypothetical protein EA406_01420 [Rhodospirillales bacterium]
MALCAVVLAAGMSACQYRPEAPRRLTPPPDAEPQSVQAMCWRRASEQVEREFARVDPDVGVGVGRVVPLSRDFQRFDAEKRRQILYERCLQQAGASGGTAPVTEGPPGS